MDAPHTMKSSNAMPSIAEMDALRKKLENEQERLLTHLLGEDSVDDRTRNSMLEIRPGVGGDESALFAADLFRMYERFCVLKGWKFEVVNVSSMDKGGVREAVASISGNGCHSILQHETGVHRVQRVPITEANNRVHTSTASVVVLPEADAAEVICVVDILPLLTRLYRFKYGILTCVSTFIAVVERAVRV